jgi:cobalt-zinc-cadmium efflux system protein
MGSNCNHSHGKGASFKTLIISVILIAGFAVIEAIGGWLAHSLALLGDAGHMASDAVALTIAAFAAWIALKPPSKKQSYGYGRAEILAAWISSLLLLAISVAVIVEAVLRIHHPPKQINGLVVMIIAAAGIIINLIVAWILSRTEKNLNTRAALLHVLSDLLASVAALVTGAVIYATHWLLIDPILSILIGVIIMISSIRLLRESVNILMEGVPAHINLQSVEDDILNLDGVSGIHDLHIWTLSSGRVALSAHIDIHDLSAWKNVLSELKKMLIQDYSIEHVTLQPEPEIFDCQPCH